jgi:hypothetical protein
LDVREHEGAVFLQHRRAYLRVLGRVQRLVADDGE